MSARRSAAWETEERSGADGRKLSPNRSFTFAEEGGGADPEGGGDYMRRRDGVFRKE